MKLKRLALRAVEDGVEGFRRQVLNRIGELEAVAFCKCLKVHARNAVGLDIAPSRGVQTAVIDAELFVRDHHLGVDEQLNAEARAGRAGAVGVVEGKEPRRNLLQRDAAVGAGIVLGKAELFPAVLQHRRHQAAGEAEGGLRRVGQAAPRALLDPNPVDDDLDRMLFVLVQGNLFRQIIDDPVRPYADIAGALRILQDLAVFALFPAHHRRHQRNAGILGQLHQTVDDLVHGLLPDLSAALRAVRDADPGVQKAEIVIDLRDGPDRRARVFRRGLLIDRNCRGQPLDGIDIGLVHLAEKHARVRAETFDIAPLPLGIDGVKGQAGLPAAGKPRDDGEFVPRNDDVDILQVVFPCPPDNNVFLHTPRILYSELFN